MTNTTLLQAFIGLCDDAIEREPEWRREEYDTFPRIAKKLADIDAKRQSNAEMWAIEETSNVARSILQNAQRVIDLAAHLDPHNGICNALWEAFVRDARIQYFG